MLRNKKGIGFIEMIAALGVIVTGVIAGLTLTTHNLISSTSSESRLVAANLAREAIEVIRNQRDSNWLANNDWFQGILTTPDDNYRLITEFNPNANSWSFTDINTTIDLCNGCEIYFDDANGVYNHDNSKTLTRYKRLVTLREICWQDPIDAEILLDYDERCDDYQEMGRIGYQIESDITWSEANQVHNLSIVDKLYDWR